MTAQLEPVPDGPAAHRQVGIDLDDLTLDELDEFAQITGRDFDDAFTEVPIVVDGQPLTRKVLVLVDGEPLRDGNGQLLYDRDGRPRMSQVPALDGNGEPIFTDQILTRRPMKPAYAKALLYLVVRRSDPAFTLEAAGKMTLSDLNAEPPDPPARPAKPSGPRSPRSSTRARKR